MTTPSPYGLMNYPSIDDLMPMNMGPKNMMNDIDDYNYPINTGNYDTMPMTYSRGYNLMKMSGGLVNNGAPKITNDYGMAGYSGRPSYGNQDQNYVIANYVNTGGNGCNHKNNGLRMKSMSNCQDYNGYSNEDDTGDYPNNNMVDQYRSNQGNTDSDYENDYYPMNKPSQQKPNTNPMTSRRSKKKTPRTTTTTTEQPNDEDDNYVHDNEMDIQQNQQFGDNETKAKKIERMLEMLDKMNR